MRRRYTNRLPLPFTFKCVRACAGVLWRGTESSESSLPNADRAADFPPPSSIDDFADDDETFSDRPAIYADYDLPDLDDLLPPSIDEDFDLRDLDDPFLPSPSVVDRTGVYPEDDMPDDENDPTDVSRPQDADRSSTTTVTIESQ